MMKKFVLGLAFVALAAAPALAGDQDFTIVNKTGYQIDEIYVSSAKTNDWEEDIMGKDALANGEKVDVSFAKRERQCKWDMKAVYNDGEEAIWENLDLCKISKVTLKYNRNTGVTSAVME